MTNNHKIKIYEFNPIIYPFRLWVGVQVPAKDIQEKFFAHNFDDTISDFTDKELLQTTVADTTYPVVERKDNWIGCFININRKDKLTVGVMAHEATHVCDMLSDRIGLVGEVDKMFSHGEARAYFVDWVSNCINEVKQGKVK